MSKYSVLQKMAEKAMKKAVQNVIENHKKTGRPVVVWQKGKVVKLSPYKIGNK